MKRLLLLACLPFLAYADVLFVTVVPPPPPAGFYGDCENGPQDQLDTRYFNSCEVGCGSNGQPINPNYLWCDDFEDGGFAATRNNKSNPDNDGWLAGVWYSYPDPDGTDYARCSGQGVAGTDCAATSYDQSNGGDATQGNDGQHWFYPDETSYTEIYVRWYFKMIPGYQMDGHDKMMDIGAYSDPGGQDTNIMIMNSNNGTGCVSVSDKVNNNNLGQNQGDQICTTPGNWYYIEMRVKYNTIGQNDGIIEVWIDNCNADGLGCTGNETKRTRYTNIANLDENYDPIHKINWITYSNTSGGSTGEIHTDQFIVSRSFIGHAEICTNCQ